MAKRPTTVLGVLKAARRLLTPRERWHPRGWAADARGNHVALMSRSARCFCLDGALMRVAGGGGAAYSMANEYVREAIGTHSREGVWDFNDAKYRRHKQVLGVLDKAIKLAVA